MEDKIFREIKDKQIATEKHYRKVMGFEDCELKEGPSKITLDLMTILSHLKLIEITDETCEKFDEFYEYLYKLGISIGIINGKRMVIEAIKSDELTLDEIMKINTDRLIEFNIEPTYIKEMRENFK